MSVNIASMGKTSMPLDANSQLCYRFDELAGATPLVQDPNSILTNAAFNLTKFAGTSNLGTPGVFGNSINFNDGNTLWKSDTDLSALTAINLATITVSCWVNTSTSPGFNAKLAAKAYRNDTSWTAPFMAWNFCLDSSFGFGAQITRAGTLSTAVTSLVASDFLSIAEWNHIGFSYDGATARLFKNGIQIQSAAFVGAIDYGTGGAIMVGGSYGGSQTPTAQIDDLRIDSVLRNEAWFRETYRRGVQ